MSIYYLNNNKGPHGAARARTRTLAYSRVQPRTAGPRPRGHKQGKLRNTTRGLCVTIHVYLTQSNH